MKLNLLRVFVEAAERGSVSEAARTLSRPRSQVSTWISDLEVDWGLPLFDRSGYRPVLTEYGKQLLPLAQKILKNMAHLEQRIEHLGQQDESALSISFDAAVSTQFRTHLISAFYHQFPEVTLSVYESPAKVIPGKLISGELQLGIGHLYLAQVDEEMKLNQAGYAQYVICARHDHPLALMDEVNEDHLQQHRGLLLNELLDSLPLDGLSRYITMPDFNSIIEMARIGSGWCIAPLSMAKEYLDNGELMILNHISGVLRSDVGCYWHRQGHFSTSGKWLVENLASLWTEHQATLS